jgi:hypothetical protein
MSIRVESDLPPTLHDADLDKLVDDRCAEIRQFLQWAANREASGGGHSLRFDARPDLERCRSVLPQFEAPWWAVVVYSCFDSTRGTRAVANEFKSPLSPPAAESALSRVEFPASSVQHHRAQVGPKRSKASLLSACYKAPALKDVLTTPHLPFDERFKRLDRIRVQEWGRTTNFDSLARAGALKVDGVGYRPERAYLLNSRGPAAGFTRIWGLAVTNSTSAMCEEILTRWTRDWHAVAVRLGVNWVGGGYDHADLENALCLFQGHD